MDLSQFSPASALLTVIVLSLLPFVAVMVTSFTKIVVVLSLLRNALGVQQIPPNLVLNGLALILTAYVMFPVGQAMSQKIEPDIDMFSDTENLLQVVDTVKEPLRDFLLKHTDEREREFFVDSIEKMAGDGAIEKVSTTDFIVVLPAFTISELTSAFQIGFLIFLPFIVIDLVIANILMAMGMMMLSPTVVSLPFKLLLFVLVEGWSKISHGLVQTYL
ncbi:MAG: type III secretion system export apparatus subunit SctR [Granulosicoccus sp.]